MRRTLISLVASAVALACAGKKLEVGSKTDDVNPGAGGTSGSGGVSSYQPLPSVPDPHACVMGTQLPIVGVWDGYVEGSVPGSPRDSFRVTINGASEENGVCGTIVYGEGTPPPPATDPDIGYPSGMGYGPDAFGYGGGPSQPMSGVTYTLLDGTVNASRVRFGTSLAELWKGWCELQTSFGASCLPASGGRVDSNGNDCALIDTQTQVETPVDCGKYYLCLLRPVCACNATECVAAAGPGLADEILDLHFDGDSADGSSSSGGRVRLFRVE